MKKRESLGVIEYRSIANGMEKADHMLKAADVELVFAKPMCPGKFVVALSGGYVEVQSAIEAGRSSRPFDTCVDDCIIGNPDPQLFEGLYLSSSVDQLDAVGIVESYSVASIFIAADEVVKTTPVKILEIRIAKGMSGKSYVTFTGDVASVTASVEKADKLLSDSGMMLSTAVIANPDPRLWQAMI